MIAQITGKLIDNTDTYSTVDVHGVGYGIFTTDTWKAKQLQDNQVTLFTFTYVKEDALELYGFSSKQEKKMFELLLSVSGIGPRTALHILNYGVKDIEKAISQADVTFFTRIPRIGKKNAQKIIIELKQRIGSVAELNLQEETGMEKDILDALISMGFDEFTIKQTMQQHYNSEQTLQTNIKTILKHISKRTL